MRKKPELLCPVGGKLQLIAAVENGADAVYLGGAEFNARIYADNFNTIESIEEAVDYAHLRNVKVYITLNTLINDEEIDEAIDYAKRLYEIGVDAVIVQDLGLIDRMNKEIPNFKVHISTQASVYSKEGINTFDKYPNIDRIVLARELSLNEITKIVKNTNKEIEIFIHGALCVCYSGQCKLSSMIGARSGNRGKCAQPCRLAYSLNIGEETYKEKYYLSTKDICGIDILPQIIQSGVKSLKIEGRMKSPEYVAAVTRVYRKYIDRYFEKSEYIVENQDKNILLQAFNRGGFSKGYLEGKNCKDIWCDGRPKNSGTYLGKVVGYNDKKGNIDVKLEQSIYMGDVLEVNNDGLPSFVVSFIRNKKERVKEANAGDVVTLGDIKGKVKVGERVYKIISKRLNDELSEYFSGKSLKKNEAFAKVELKIGKKPKIKIGCNILEKDFEIEISEGIECEKGIKKVLTETDVKANMSKTGDVPFIMQEIAVVLDDGVMTTMANLNNLRRVAIDKLKEKITKSFKNKYEEIKKVEVKNNQSIKERRVNTKLTGYIYNIDLLDNLEELERLDRVCFSLENVIKYREEILQKLDKSKVWIYLPTVTNSKYIEYMKENIDFIKEIKNLVITNIEHIEIFKDMNLNLYLDNSFNLFNTYSTNSISRYNIEGINLSNELTLEQICKMKIPKGKQVEVDVYGNMQVMYSNYCVLNAINKCSKKTNKYYLIDRKKKEFPVLFNHIQCTSQVLNTAKLFSKEAIKVLSNKVDYMRIYLYDESKEERKCIIDSVKKLLNNQEIDTDKFVSNSKVQYTNGHFFREV